MSERFAGYVATLGRGPGRSRALTRAEAEDAMGMLLAGEADPVQVGAFLMLLRYRGEDPEEITGLVLGARPVCPWRGWTRRWIGRPTAPGARGGRHGFCWRPWRWARRGTGC